MSKMNFLFKKFRSSIRIMYIDEPVKLQAIDDMWTAFRILERTAKSFIGAGSPTAELIFRFKCYFQRCWNCYWFGKTWILLSV